MATQPTVSAQGSGSVSADQLNAYVLSVSTAPTLRTVVGVTGMTASLQGITAANDGGQGIFYWNGSSTATDDNLSVIVPYGVVQGAWIRQPAGASSSVTVAAGSGVSVTQASNVFTVSATYKAPNANSVTRNTTTRLSDCYHAADFGVDLSGALVGAAITTNTANFQAFVNACISDNRPGFIGAGSVQINSAITISNTVALFGAGRAVTNVVLTSPTQNGLVVTTTAPVYLSDFGFVSATGGQAAGAGVLVDPGGSNINTESVFHQLKFISLYNCIDLERAGYFDIGACNFENMAGAGVIVQDLAAADTGDGTIHDCTFIYASAVNNSSQCAINQTSSGGLRVVNNKFANGFRGYFFNLLTGANTGSNVTVGNSFENQYDAAIFITPQTPGSGTLSKWTITGNEFLCFGNSYGLRVFSTSTNTWFTGVVVAGNVFQINGLGSGSSTGHAIDMTYCSYGVITGNMLFTGGAGSATIGVSLTSNVNAFAHAGNNIQGFTTAVSDSSTNPYSSY